MNNPLSIKMPQGLYQVEWHDDGTVSVEKLLNTTGKVLVNRYIRHGAVTILQKESTEDVTYILFVVEEAPSDVHISKESVIADLLEGIIIEGDAEARRIETLNDLNKAFLNIE